VFVHKLYSHQRLPFSDLQVNSNAVSVKLVWIKAGKSVEKTGETTSQAQKKEAPLTFHQEKERQTYWIVRVEFCWFW
jgi:hypothetical protein